MGFLRHLIPERIPWFAAGLYDKAARAARTSYYQVVAKEVVANIDCGNILDIGTGPGYLPIEIAKMAPNIRIEGIDLSRRLIKIAHSNAKEANVLTQVNFKAGDANNLRFEDNRFDMVVSTGSFHSWKNPVRVLNECYRVLKAGGQAWIYDPAKIATEEMTKLWLIGKRDHIAYKWASLTHRVMAGAYSIDGIHQIVGKTKFPDYQVELGEWTRIKLRK